MSERNMAGHNTIKPSYSIPNHTTPGHHINITTKTSSFNVKNTTNIILSSSTVSVINNKSPNSKSGDLDMLFTLVFIACVVLALLLVISLFMVIVCWKVKTRRSRTANLTEVRKGDGKERKRGRVNLRNSIKRVFVSDGPLYAVSNLNNSRCYTGIPEATQNNPNIDSARSSPEPEIVIQANEPDEISKVNDHVIYQRYLSPIEGVPSSPSSASLVAKEREDQTYLQPIDELRASKRFLDRSKNGSPEPEVAYLEPLHGIPEPDEVHQKPYKPIPSPKPKVKPKP